MKGNSTVLIAQASNIIKTYRSQSLPQSLSSHTLIPSPLHCSLSLPPGASRPPMAPLAATLRQSTRCPSDFSSCHLSFPARLPSCSVFPNRPLQDPLFLCQIMKFPLVSCLCFLGSIIYFQLSETWNLTFITCWF